MPCFLFLELTALQLCLFCLQESGPFFPITLPETAILPPKQIGLSKKETHLPIPVFQVSFREGNTFTSTPETAPVSPHLVVSECCFSVPGSQLRKLAQCLRCCFFRFYRPNYWFPRQTSEKLQISRAIKGFRQKNRHWCLILHNSWGSCSQSGPVFNNDSIETTLKQPKKNTHSVLRDAVPGFIELYKLPSTGISI